MPNERCLICTVTFNRLEMTKRCLDSLFLMTNPALYRLVVIDNGSTDGTVDYLKSLTNYQIEDIIFNEENLGTAQALNMGWKIAASRGQYAGKLDNDVVFYDNNWLDKVISVLDQTEDVGLVGLKRRDLEEKPNHNDNFFRSHLFALPSGQVVEIAEHVIGTCWTVHTRTLEEVGALVQIGPYGLDDALYCIRLRLAGMVPVFVPDVAIEHIDPGHSKYPEFTQWKIDRATEVFQSGAYDKLRDSFINGERPIYEPF